MTMTSWNSTRWLLGRRLATIPRTSTAFAAPRARGNVMLFSQRPLCLATSSTWLPYYQQQHPLQFFSTSTASQWTQSQLQLQTPKKGTGFDNFTPRNDKNKESEKENNNKKETESNSKQTDKNKDHDKDFLGSFRSSSSGGGGGSGGNNNNNSNNNDPRQWQTWVPALLMVLAAYTFLGRGNNDTDGQRNSEDDDDLSWHEFLQLLQQQPSTITKIVVTEDRQHARIFVKSRPRHWQRRRHNGGRGPSYQERRQQQQQHSRREMEHHHHEQQDDPNETSDMSSSTQVKGLDVGYGNVASISSGSSTQQPHALFYRMPIGNVDSFERKLDEAQRALKRHPDQDIPVQYLPTNDTTKEVLAIVPGLLLAGLLYTVFSVASRSFGAGGGGGGRGGMGGLFQIGKSTHKKINKQDISITFDDVAGCDQAKAEVEEFVSFLKDSERFTKLGAKIPKGALLCGPPGTGKTLLAKAVAGEAGVPFFSISGSDFIEMFVGVGPSRVRDLFSEARQNAPCIIFIDEIDAVGRQRGRGGMGGNDERENTLNQLLVEMDGFDTTSGVVVLAGTNRVDILDQALTRPGRFDRQITVDKPDLGGRKEIFLVHLNGITLEGDVQSIASRLAGLTPGFAGADIANICNEAAIVAARRNAETVTIDDFEKAIDRIIGGLESNKIMSKEERSIVAHHEAGHAVAGWFLEHADPLMKVTIIPRSSGALGFAQYLPKEVNLRTQNQIMDIVCMALAGRAAEEIFFGSVTTGAQDDLKRVTDIVYSTIQLYGMNSRLGQLSFPKDPNAFFDERPYSDKTARAMDEEARLLVDGAYERTLNLLKEKKEQVEAVAKLLLEKETITHDDMIDVVGERPFQGDPQYQEYVRRKKWTLEDENEAKEKKDKEEADKDKESQNDSLHPEPSL